MRPTDSGSQCGFYLLMNALHLRMSQQEIAASDADSFLDAMHMVHAVRGHEITLYNRVASARASLRTME